jgi:hypothetical protein
MMRITMCLALALGCCFVLASDIPPPREAVDVAALVRQLESGDFAEREAATEKLSALTVDEPPAALLAALKSPNPEVRDRAAKAVKAIRERAALRHLPRDERFATRGRVDLFVASTAALKLKPEDERLWAPAAKLGAKAVALAGMKDDRKPRGPAAARDFPTYRAKLNPGFVRTRDVYTRPKADAKGNRVSVYPTAIQAAGVRGEHMLVGLVVSRGPVAAKGSVNESLVLATGDVDAEGGIVNSVVICDGDVRTPLATTSLIIARGEIEVKGRVSASTLIAGRTATVGELPAEQQRPIPLADPNDPDAVANMKRRLVNLEMVRVEVKEKEPNPFGFITFFELHRVGLEVKAADGAVTVAKVAAGKPSDKAGFEVGDVVLDVNGKKPADAESLRRLLRDALAVGDAAVKLKRGDKTESVKLSLPE